MSEWHHRSSTHLHTVPVRRRPREVTPRQVAALIALTLAIVAVIVVVILQSEPAASVAPLEVTRAAVPQPTSTPGTPLPRKPVEKSPPIPVSMPGDGTYLVGRTIKAGTYTAAGPDDGGRCYWARLKNTSGEVSAVITASYKRGRQVVTIGRRDKAFVSDGCGPWEPVKP